VWEEGDDTIEDGFGDLGFAHEGEGLGVLVGGEEGDLVGLTGKAAAFFGDVVGYDQIEVFALEFALGIFEEALCFGGEAHGDPFLVWGKGGEYIFGAFKGEGEVTWGFFHLLGGVVGWAVIGDSSRHQQKRTVGEVLAYGFGHLGSGANRNREATWRGLSLSGA